MCGSDRPIAVPAYVSDKHPFWEEGPAARKKKEREGRAGGGVAAVAPVNMITVKFGGFDVQFVDPTQHKGDAVPKPSSSGVVVPSRGRWLARPVAEPTSYVDALTYSGVCPCSFFHYHFRCGFR